MSAMNRRGNYMKSYNLDMDINFYEENQVKAPKYKFRALCTSDLCHYKRPKLGAGDSDIGVSKFVPISTVWCPTCGSALLWERYTTPKKRKFK